FPTAAQIGGEVFPDRMEAGDPFPTDWALYDESGEKVDVAALIDGKRTVFAFFTTAVPMSVHQVEALDSFVSRSGDDTQVLLINADTVGTALLGEPKLEATIRTVNTIKREQDVKAPMYVAPNDALSPTGLSNTLHFRSLPSVFVVDPQGKVERVYVGRHDWSKTKI
ncbi:MAG: peroxiredoxin family protein, partial [Salinisphaera sp.]|nr:peroxiredoxin family protein [Salinisphaera sp.]